MNIYIYGSNSFQKEISKVLAISSIQDKLDEISEVHEDIGNIIRVNGVNELKKFIIQYPKSIFLIDKEKIIQDNILTQKLTFLNPKDGIKESFLEENEISIKVELDDVAGIAQYILSKLETYNINEITQINEMRELDVVLALQEIN